MKQPQKAPEDSAQAAGAGFEPELRDILAALAPISLEDAVLRTGFIHDPSFMLNETDMGIAMALLASMRYRYADAMLEARNSKAPAAKIKGELRK